MNDEAKVDHLTDRLREQLDQIERGHRESAGPCDTCRFSGWEQSPRYLGQACRNPLLTNPEFDPASGKVKHQVVMTKDARSIHGDCGPKGLLWMPPEPEIEIVNRQRGWFVRTFFPWLS